MTTEERTDEETRAELVNLRLFASWLATIRDYDNNPHMLGPRDVTLQDIIDRARAALGPAEPKRCAHGNSPHCYPFCVSEPVSGSEEKR